MLLGGFQARRRSLQGFRRLLIGGSLVGFTGCGAGTGQAVSAKTDPPAVARPGTLSSIPDDHVWVTRGTRRYAYHDGRFFEWLPEERRYLAVAAPHGVAIPNLPRGSRETRIRGVSYYVYRGVYYKVTRRDGRRVFVVAKL